MFRLLVVFALLLPLLRAQVKINEVQQSSLPVSHAELRNCGNVAVDISGWSLKSWVVMGILASPVAQPTFVFPAGTVIPPQGFLLCEAGGSAGAPGQQSSSMSMGVNLQWSRNRSLVLTLVDGQGQGVDYLYNNISLSAPQLFLPPGTQWSGSLDSPGTDVLARRDDADTDDAGDWIGHGGWATSGALNPGQTGASCVAPILYQTNSAGARASIDGTESTGLTPAITTRTTCTPGTLTIQSSLPNTAFDVALTTAPVVPVGAPGTLTLAGGSGVVNLDLQHPSLSFFHGPIGPHFIPYATPVVLNDVISTPQTVSIQAAFLDPASPSGFLLSQACQFESVASLTTVAGPTGTFNSHVLVDLSTLCGPIHFFGRSYDHVGISNAGRLDFSIANGDFTASRPEARTQSPFLGYWTNFDPQTGSISATDSSTRFTVTWDNVSYAWEQLSPLNTFSIEYDRVTGELILSGLSGIQPNPVLSSGLEDAIFMGLSPGFHAPQGSAVDPGAVLFAPGASGSSPNGDQMIYDAVDSWSVVPGVPLLPPSLSTTSVDRIHFTPLPGGGYTWAAY